MESFLALRRERGSGIKGEPLVVLNWAFPRHAADRSFPAMKEKQGFAMQGLPRCHLNTSSSLPGRIDPMEQGPFSSPLVSRHSPVALGTPRLP